MTKEPSPDAIAAAQYLYDAIKEHSPDFCAAMPPKKLGTKVQGWARAIDVGLRNDGMTLEGCKTVIDIAHRSRDTFWRDKFGNGKKVRDKYQDFLIKAKQGKPPKGEEPGNYDDIDFDAFGDNLDRIMGR